MPDVVIGPDVVKASRCIYLRESTAGRYLMKPNCRLTVALRNSRM